MVIRHHIHLKISCFFLEDGIIFARSISLMFILTCISDAFDNQQQVFKLYMQTSGLLSNSEGEPYIGISA